MLRLTRKDAAAARRAARAARARRALVTLMTIAFATFISVANATADELGAVEEQPTSAEVVLVPSEPIVEAPAPVIEETPIVETTPEPIVETAPEPIEVSQAESVVEPVVIVDNSVSEQPGQALQKSEPIRQAVQAPEPVVAAAHPAHKIKCPGNGICRVSGGAGAWTIAADDSVRVCHATNGEASLGNGFNAITPNSDSIHLPGDTGNNHGDHPKDNFWTTSYSVSDIIESFDYFTGDANSNGKVDDLEVAHFQGANLTDIAYPQGVSWATIYGAAVGTTGAQILAAGCGAPAPANPNGPIVCTPPLIDFDAGAALDCRPPMPRVRAKRVAVCHSNGNGTYNLATWRVRGAVNAGHGTDAGDVIPAFNYTVGYTWNAITKAWDRDIARYAGQNLTTLVPVTYNVPGFGPFTIDVLGSALLAANCAAAPTVPTQPIVQHNPITVCHATSGNGTDFYVLDTVDDDSIVKTAGHGAHDFDVIPAFTYETGHTYDPATNKWVTQTATYAGKNLGTFTRQVRLPKVGLVTWTFNGQAMLRSGSCGFTQPAPQPPVVATPVTLCHATTLAGFDTYTTFVGTSDDVIAAGTHGGDANDVIPAFTYTTGHTYDAATDTWTPVTQSYPGQNLGTFSRAMNLPLIGSVTRSLDGTRMLATGCQVPALPARPDLQPVSVTMCHAGTVDGRDTFSSVTTDHNAVIGAGGHDADANDIIPSFSYTTGYTYDHVTNTWIAQTASYAGKNLGTFTRTVNLASGPAMLTFDGTAMLAAGTCPMPAVLGSADAPAPNADPTPGPDVTAGGDEPVAVDADPVDPETAVEADAEEPAAEPAAADDNALPFTGLELGVLLLIGLGAIGAGSVLHGARRRRRIVVND